MGLALATDAALPTAAGVPDSGAVAVDTPGAATAAVAIDLEAELRRLVGHFEAAEDMGRAARERSERCRDYYSNIQLTAAELATLKKRRQAPVYVNYIQRKVDTLCGIERRTRTDPKAFARTPQDDEAANAATDALRFVSDQNRFDGVRSEVFNDLLVEGTGGVEVAGVERPNGEVDVTIKRVPWDRLWYDPHSRELDFSDAAYLGIVIWSDAEDVRRDYPGREDAVEGALSWGVSETYDDRPKYTWCDSKRKRLRVVQCHYDRGGEWWVATYTRGGFLVDPVVSPYLDKYGAPACPLVLRSGYVNRDNERYGHVEGLLPLQDEINKRRSKALHLLSVRQTYGNRRAIADATEAKVQLARPDGHVELNEGAVFGQDFGVLPTGDMAQGQVLMLQQALSEMQATGANAALAGKDERSQSGRALQTRAQMGATELEPQIDGQREWTHAVYEAAWLRVRQLWTEEKWVRITDDDRNVQWVGLNKPVTLDDQLAQMQPDERAQAMQALGLQPDDPRLQQVVAVENQVSGLDVDIVIEDGPDIASLQSEQFEQLVQLATSPVAQGLIPFTAIIKASSLRNKDAILEEIEKAQAAKAQQQQAMQAEAHAVGKAQAESEIAERQAKAKKADAEATETQVDTQIKGLQALMPAPQPMPVYQ